MSTLYIVATPIGNLEDIGMRALRILGEVDFILCEDTRVTRVLLEHYNIKIPTISYHQHSSESKVNEVINLLASGKNLALVTDAGTPGISDPGGKLIRAVIERFGVGTMPSSPVGAQNIVPVRIESVPSSPVGAQNIVPVRIESVPGPSAVTAALSISGIPTDKFIFMGFPPHKKGRQTFIRKIMASEWPAVIYESKHRIIKFLEELGKMTNDKYQMTNQVQNPNDKKINLTSVVVCRELSKMHEIVYRGTLESIIEKIKADKNDQKGEFVVIVGK